MRTKMAIVSCICIIPSLFGYSLKSDSSKDVVPYVLEVTNPHHLYIGPEVLWYQLRAHVGGVKISGTRPFYGSRLAYEYIKSRDVYTGIDWLCAHSVKDYRSSIPNQAHADRHFGNIDFRLGYSFAPGNWVLSPFFGIGGYSLFPKDHHNREGLREAFGYISLGARSFYAFSSTFNLGLNGRLNWADGEQIFRFSGYRLTRHQHSVLGGEVSVPFTWYMGTPKNWNIQFEPYALTLNFAQVQNIYGARLLAAYRF